MIDHISQGMALGHCLWHGPPMQSTSPRAGGFFLILAIFAGAVIGWSYGDPTGGAILGTIAGIALATLIWLIDRSRR